MLTELTPLPIDIIKYCIQPYLTRAPTVYHTNFERTLEQLCTVKDVYNLLNDLTIWEIMADETQYRKRQLALDIERSQIYEFNNIEY